MPSKVDLNKLREELESRKQTSTRANESDKPKDNFLFELEASLRNGSESRATNRIKLIENKTAEKLKENTVYPEISTSQQKVEQRKDVRPVPQQNKYIGESQDREEQMYRELNNRVKGGLGDALEEFSGNSRGGYKQPNIQNPNMINEEMLNKAVKKIVIDFLGENLQSILEEAIKETILEMYAMDRIKTVITENKDILKTAVYDIIRDLQNKNKEKK